MKEKEMPPNKNVDVQSDVKQYGQTFLWKWKERKKE